MSARTIQNIFPAVRDDIADLQTWRAMPTQYIDHLDPFLFLNYHGRQIYPPANRGLPFGPHPHRGFETVTFILEGDIAHRDSGGHESVIGPQGVQWMTAGRGLVHSETSSEEFKRNGGPLEVLQLWVNLPARLKMTEPRYIGLQGEAIPLLAEDDGRVSVHLVSGTCQGRQGAVTPLLDVTAMLLRLQQHGQLRLSIPLAHNVFFYVMRGSVRVNGQTVDEHHLADFRHDGEQLEIAATRDSMVLLCHALPLGEPIVAHGPFVMNTKEEIAQAILDYQAGRFNA
jgi:redox-sensitive bicupin YhaK (pirin superfamily)